MTQPSSFPTRRGLVAGAGAMGLAGTPITDSDVGDLRADIASFVGFGVHRAGTSGERATTRWLAHRLRSHGFRVSIRGIPIRTVMGPSGAITCGDLQGPAFPQWRPPRGTLNVPLEARLAQYGGDLSGSLALTPKPFPTGAYWGAQQQLAAETAARSGARALIIAMDDPTDNIYACNQDSLDNLALPVATVSPTMLVDLNQNIGSMARLQLSGTETEVNAQYMLAHRPGRGRAIVISTPLTGWFRCGAERGPGIALMLALAADLAHVTRPIFLVATGAHELGHLGMKQALASGELPIVTETEIWLHLGAGICAVATDGRFGVKSTQYLTLSPSLMGADFDAFSATDWTRLQANPKAPGEAGDVIAAGYQRVIGLAGFFPGFHTPGDDGSAVDYARLGQVRNQLLDLLLSVSRA